MGEWLHRGNDASPPQHTCSSRTTKVAGFAPHTTKMPAEWVVREETWCPLDPTRHEIRLLTIPPAPCKQDVMACALSIVSLDDYPTFEALSYTRGDSASQVEILLRRGKPWKVTKNLSEALIHFRQTQLPKIMFVDALCIDQSSITEKNLQVPLMRRIYSEATVVRCWLGLSTVGSDRAMEILRLSSKNQHMKDMIVAGFPESPEDLVCLMDLLMRPYWRRAWILQEVVLARRAIFHCGKHRLISHHLPTISQFTAIVLSGVANLSANNQPAAAMNSNGTLSLKAVEVINSYVALSSMLSRKCQGNLGWPTTGELTIWTAQLASVQHDHVYAILGTLAPALAQRVVPNYAMSVSDVFRDFAFAYMHVRNSGRLLARSTCLKPNDPHIPTWVPDFSTFPVMDLTSEMFQENDQVEPEFCMTKEGLLGVNAFHMDHIVDCRPVKVDGETLFDLGVDIDRALDYHRVWREFFKLHESDKSSYVGGGQIEEAYWRTMCLDRYNAKHPYEIGYGCPWLLQKHIAACSSWYASRHVSAASEDEHFVQQWNRCLAMLGKHQLFWTAKGYFGVADTESVAEPGDEVFLIAATANPFLLRRCRAMDDRTVYKLVGAAYVHGTMLRLVTPDDVCEELPAINYESYVHPHMRIATSWDKVWLA